MKIIVTGGAGFIGSAVIRQAIADGHEVLNVDCLTYAANLYSLKSVSSHQSYSFINLNICDEARVRGVFSSFQPDAVMHLAAESHVDRSIDGPSAFMQTNILGTYVLLQCARNYRDTLPIDKAESFRFHHISTDEVYGDLSETDSAFLETTPYDPSSPYSASKAASDHLVRAWSRTFGLPVLITNCSNNYGPFQFPEKLIPVVILKALHRQSIPVYGQGTNIRDWLHVDDHSNALLTVLSKGQVGETYNIGGNNERSNIELVQTLCNLISEKLDDGFDYFNLIEFVEDRPGHDRRYAIDARKIKKELTWEPSVTFNAGFKATLDWYCANEWWWRPLIDADKFGDRLGVSVKK